MKRSSRSSRTPATLSDSVHQQLNMYALAASAAGVGVLALAAPAEARIVYTPTHHVIAEGGHYRLDVNHDGITDFSLQAQITHTTGYSGFYASLSAVPAAGNGVEGWTGSRPWASALKAGGRIGSRHYFPGKVMAFYCSPFCSGGPSGSWVNVNNRYLGLQVKIGGKIHYGWARLNVKIQGSSIVGTLTGYAYETVPGKPIKAGQTKDGDDATVQPASLGHLAQGASAISAWRGK
jgi:hypothetical protein